MNKIPLLEKFAAQSLVYVDTGLDDGKELVFSKEKFAELIVKECADYCKGHILPKDVAEQNGLTYNDGVGDCAIGLEQHFGVEE